ncbi:hypothetical protein PGB90_003934 [Kerria lacca]
MSKSYENSRQTVLSYEHIDINMNSSYYWLIFGLHRYPCYIVEGDDILRYSTISARYGVSNKSLCGSDGRMKCDPKSCSPEPYVQQMLSKSAFQR